MSDAKRDWSDVYGEEYRQRGLYIIGAHYDAAAGLMHIDFEAGFTISFAKNRSQVTVDATDEDLSEIAISSAGWSVDFPRIDNGLSLEGLLAGKFGNTRWEREWAEKHRAKEQERAEPSLTPVAA